MSLTLVSQMQALPKAYGSEIQAFTRKPTLKISLLIPAKNASHSIQETVGRTYDFLNSRFPGSFEILVIPTLSPDDSTFEIAQELSQKFAAVRVIAHEGPVGKGAALRTGFLASQGELIFFTDADLPYDLSFFDSAFALLQQGKFLVTGNRRLASSHFQIPVELLPIAFSRHRLGLLFNRVVRMLLPIRTTDTQAGIKAMNRDLAVRAFSTQACPGFFFDLELILSTPKREEKHQEIPVTLYLNSEKSTVRIAREAILALFWLTRITFRHWSGRYQSRF